MAIPGINVPKFAMIMCGTLGIMGILTPYATRPSPVSFGSGYLPAKDYWQLGATSGFASATHVPSSDRPAAQKKRWNRRL